MPAVYELWFIGDDLLTLALPVYQQMKTDHNNGQVLNYLESSYDTYFFDGDYRERNHLNMICNAFTRGLNERPRLPHTMVILTSNKFFLNQSTFLPSEADKKIRWILKEFDHLLRTRKEDIPYKAHQGQRTRIIWVQILPLHADVWKLKAAKKRDQSPYPERLNRFNKLLFKICEAKNHHFLEIKDIIDTDGKALSRYTGNPTEFGFELIFKEITRTVKILDSQAREQEKDRIMEDEIKHLRLQNKLLQERSGRSHHYTSPEGNKLHRNEQSASYHKRFRKDRNW